MKRRQMRDGRWMQVGPEKLRLRSARRIGPSRGGVIIVVALAIAVAAATTGVTGLSLSMPSLAAEDLYTGKNPYVQSDEIRVGEILKLVVDEPVVVEYEYEGDRDEHGVIKLAPDKQLFSFLPGATDERSFNDHARGKIRSRVRLRLNLAVRIAGIENGVARFDGGRRLGYEQSRLEQQMTVAGAVSLADIAKDRTVLSRHVADLNLVVKGRPAERRENLQLKQQPPSHDGELPQIKADMSDSEKQRALLQYLNRLLGETGTVVP